MKVKAKRNIRDAAGWHLAGSVFETDKDFGDAVEVLEAPVKKPVKRVEKPVEEKKPEPEVVETVQGKEQAKEESPRPRSSRRKTMTK